MRCLTLACALSDLDVECHFICRNQPGNLAELIHNKGFPVHRLSSPEIGGGTNDKGCLPPLAHAAWLGASQEQDALECTPIVRTLLPNWLIVDHYGIDIRWQTTLRPHYRKLMVIDDLADRMHQSDLLLDQNWFGEKTGIRYDDLVPQHTVKLLGPQYALLKPEYAQLRALMPPRDGIVRRLVVFLGGSDPDNQTAKVVRALMAPDLVDLAADIVIGVNHPDPSGIADLVAARPNTNFHRNVPSLAGLMARADLMVGAGGAATWERMSLGLPSIVLSIASNQTPTNIALMEAGYIDFIGEMANVTIADVAAAVRRAVSAPHGLKEQSAIMQQLVPATGLMALCRQLTALE